ncbi:hypothetical protein R80B4_02423 [Fibrobacteres bacterium R8-0-B4]
MRYYAEKQKKRRRLPKLRFRRHGACAGRRPSGVRAFAYICAHQAQRAPYIHIDTDDHPGRLFQPRGRRYLLVQALRNAPYAHTASKYRAVGRLQGFRQGRQAHPRVQRGKALLGAARQNSPRTPKRRHSHRRPQVLQPLGYRRDAQYQRGVRQPRPREEGPGRLHHHPAARPQPLPLLRQNVHPQDTRGAHRRAA